METMNTGPQQSPSLTIAIASILMFVGRVALYTRHHAGHIKTQDGETCRELGNSVHNLERLGRWIYEMNTACALSELQLLQNEMQNNQTLIDHHLNEIGANSMKLLKQALTEHCSKTELTTQISKK